MLRVLKIMAFFAIAVSCASTSNKQSWAPPKTAFISQVENEAVDAKSVEIYLQKFLETHSDQPSHWWAKYQLARLWTRDKPQQACHAFRELSGIRTFALNGLALIRAFEVCPINVGGLDLLVTYLEDTEDKWLNELITEIGTKRSKEIKSERHQMLFAYYSSKYAPTQTERIAFLKSAMATAQKIDDQDFYQKSEERLFKIAPRLAPKNEKVSRFKLAYDYRRVRNFKKAKKIYYEIVKDKNSTSDEVYRGYQGLRAVAKLTHNTKGVIEASRQIEKKTRQWFKSSRKRNKSTQYYANLYHKGALLFARTLWTEDQRSRAYTNIKKTIRDLKGYKTREHLYWLLARMEEEAGNFQKASEFTALALKDAKPRTKIWEKLQWQLAWNLRKIKEYQKSIQVFEEVLPLTDSNFLSAKYRYWMARNYKDIGDQVRAYIEYENLTKSDPLGYYGLLAYRDMNKAIPPLKDRDFKFFRPDRAPSSSNAEVNSGLIEWLVAVGEEEAAKSYILNSQKGLEEKTGVENLIRLYALAGDYNRVFGFLASADPGLRNKMVLSSPALLFPRPHYSVVSELSQRYAVRPEMVYAIMRQESAFNRFARSPADAFGLMQLIPKVAQKTAKSVRVGYKEPEDLYKPSVNIKLGVHFLKQLLTKYQDQFILTVASYNASESAVRGWVKTRFKGDATEFIEDVPYEETKLYIKLVMRNMIFYRRLLSDNARPFPEWTMNGLDSFKQ